MQKFCCLWWVIPIEIRNFKSVGSGKTSVFLSPTTVFGLVTPDKWLDWTVETKLRPIYVHTRADIWPLNRFGIVYSGEMLVFFPAFVWQEWTTTLKDAHACTIITMFTNLLLQNDYHSDRESLSTVTLLLSILRRNSIVLHLRFHSL